MRGQRSRWLVASNVRIFHGWSVALASVLSWVIQAESCRITYIMTGTIESTSKSAMATLKARRITGDS